MKIYLDRNILGINRFYFAKHESKYIIRIHLWRTRKNGWCYRDLVIEI